MRAPSNTYVPLTLAGSETRVLVVEDEATRLPLYDGCIWLRSLEPTTSFDVFVDTILMVTGAGISFSGEWENRLVETVLGPEAWLRIQLPVSCADGLYTRHRITLTNQSVSEAAVHLLINGSMEATNPQPSPTFVVVP